MMRKFFSDKKNIVITSIVALAVIIAIVAVCILLYSDKTTSKAEDDNKILKGITVSGDDVGTLTKEQAKEKLEKLSENTDSLVLNFKCNDSLFSVNGQDITLKPEVDKAVENAYEIGRTKDEKKNKKDRNILKTKGIDVPMTFAFDKEKFLLIAGDYAASEISDASDMIVEIVSDGLVITNATKGIGIDMDKLTSDIEAELRDYVADAPIVLTLKEYKGKNLSFDELAKQYFKEAKDAVYTQNGDSYTIEPEVIGIAVNKDEAKKIFEQNKNSTEAYKIPAKVTYPKVTAKALEDKYVNKILASYSSSFAGSSAGRCENIRLATSKINGYVLNPGEKFSYNKVVGPRTEAAGFKIAHVYVGNQVVDGIGGGICQVSSTLYNAQVMADLKTVSRTNHSIPVSYVPMGRDATVAYGSIDYVFENNKTFPVIIKAEISGTTLTVSIVGTQIQDYTVEFVSAYNSGIAYTTVKTEDPSMEEGTEKVVTKGTYGSVYDSYRVYKRNGVEFDRKYESKSRYVPTNQHVAVGTKKPEPSVEDKPQPEVLPGVDVSEPRLPEEDPPAVDVPSENSEPVLEPIQPETDLTEDVSVEEEQLNTD